MFKLNSHSFYQTYFGHNINDLRHLYDNLKQQNKKSFIFLAGDSSLDNKYWLGSDSYKDAVNGYETTLEPAKMKPDIAYHLNNLLIKVNPMISAINCAVEESTLQQRCSKPSKFNPNAGLLPQDKFIRDNITEDDILIVSVGGNDIALKPSFKTIWNMSTLVYFNSKETIEKGPEYAYGLPYFTNMFHKDVENYINQLTSKAKPKKIMVCMIYYPDTHVTGSWADRTLGYLGYNKDSTKLKLAIQQIFKYGTSNVKIENCETIPFPMFVVLDGSNTEDYVERVEPSSKGGKKLAVSFLKNLL